MSADGGAPLLVTGMPRTATSWVGKMLEASGALVYVNEPLNPQHPPGRSPGVLRADVSHAFQYISEENERVWLPAFRDTVRLRFHPLAELLAQPALVRDRLDRPALRARRRAAHPGRHLGRVGLAPGPDLAQQGLGRGRDALVAVGRRGVQGGRPPPGQPGQPPGVARAPHPSATSSAWGKFRLQVGDGGG